MIFAILISLIFTFGIILWHVMALEKSQMMRKPKIKYIVDDVDEAKIIHWSKL